MLDALSRWLYRVTRRDLECKQTEVEARQELAERVDAQLSALLKYMDDLASDNRQARTSDGDQG